MTCDAIIPIFLRITSPCALRSGFYINYPIKWKTNVIMSLEDFKSYEETAYLISSPKNAERLNQAIAEVEAGKSKQHKIIEE